MYSIPRCNKMKADNCSIRERQTVSEYIWQLQIVQNQCLLMKGNTVLYFCTYMFVWNNLTVTNSKKEIDKPNYIHFPNKESEIWRYWVTFSGSCNFPNKHQSQIMLRCSKSKVSILFASLISECWWIAWLYMACICKYI